VRVAGGRAIQNTHTEVRHTYSQMDGERKVERDGEEGMYTHSDRGGGGEERKALRKGWRRGDGMGVKGVKVAAIHGGASDYS
jgi:hypothetical protein